MYKNGEYMPEKIIFYSWQSDSDNKYNRNFIENSIKQAVKELNREDTNSDYLIDRDTKNIPGMPSIEDTIIEKINISDVFIADVSIINPESVRLRDERPVSNPNVLFELGYAMCKLGAESIIGIFNNFSGNIEQLPFDIRQKRIIQYSLSDESDRQVIKKSFVANLKKAISLCSEEKEEILISRNSLIHELLVDIWLVTSEIKLLKNNPSIKKIINNIYEDSQKYSSTAFEINNDQATTGWWSTMCRELGTINVINNYDENWELIEEKAKGALLFCNTLFDKLGFNFDETCREKSILELKNVTKKLLEVKNNSNSVEENIRNIEILSTSIRKMSKYNLFPQVPKFQYNIDSISLEFREMFFKSITAVNNDELHILIDEIIDKFQIFMKENNLISNFHMK